MSDADALLAAVLAEPDADLPRLVYADWLEENGRPERAEFIRVQVELASAPARDPRTVALRAAEKTLLAGHGAAWLAPLRARGEPLFDTDQTHGLFRRGFVEVVWMPAAWFAWRAERLFARTPARELRVTRATPHELAAVLASPHFARLAGLDLSDRRLGNPAATLLAKSPAVAGLRHLRLRACNLTDAGAIRLAGVPFDWHPTELDVSLNPLTDAGLTVLRTRYGPALRFDRG